MITLTEQNIRATMTKGIGLNKAQARLYGFNYPLRKGWLERLVGKKIDSKTYNTILSLRGDKKGGDVQVTTNTNKVAQDAGKRQKKEDNDRPLVMILIDKMDKIAKELEELRKEIRDGSDER